MTTENHHFPRALINSRIEALEAALRELNDKTIPSLINGTGARFKAFDTSLERLEQSLDTKVSELTDHLNALRTRINLVHTNKPSRSY